MSARVEPALTPEEWATALRADPLYLPGGSPFAHLNVGVDACFDGTFEAEALPAVIALANAALPDGHPGKITRDDLFHLGEVPANFRAWAETGAGDFLRGQMREYGDNVERLAAKLAALLPPEGT